MTPAATACSPSSATALPAPLRNWLNAQYPTLAPKESWLQQTITSYRGPRSAADGKLIEHVHEVLLNADLSEVSGRSALGAVDIEARKESVLGAGARGAVLVQVVGKLDIGVSAQTQLDVLEARRTARFSMAGGAALYEDHARDVQGEEREQPNPDHGDHINEFTAAEEAATLPSTVFPRSMLQLQLSDGFTTLTAFEHRRIPALSMAGTPLGTKLILRDVRVNKGRLCLEPKGVIVKGGQIAALERDAEERLIDHLRDKLGKPRLERRARGRGEQRGQQPLATPMVDAGPHHTVDATAVAGRSTSRRHDAPSTGPPSSFDEAQFEQDEAMWAELQEEVDTRPRAAVPSSDRGEHGSSHPRQSPSTSTMTPVVPSTRITTGRRAIDKKNKQERTLSSPSPPPRLPARKKLKETTATAAVSEIVPRVERRHAGDDDESGKDEKEREKEEQFRASFFASGMSDVDVDVDDLANADADVDFMILDKNDQGNPIVLSDSD